MVVWDRPAEPRGGKRRAWRVTTGAAALVALIVAVLVVANWGVVRDHVEAWHFQLKQDTAMIESDPKAMSRQPRTEEQLLHFAAAKFHRPVIFSPHEVTSFQFRPIRGRGVREILENRGWRIIEQRFPRRAYVVIRAADPIEQTILDPPLVWDN